MPSRPGHMGAQRKTEMHANFGPATEKVTNATYAKQYAAQAIEKDYGSPTTASEVSKALAGLAEQVKSVSVISEVLCQRLRIVSRQQPPTLDGQNPANSKAAYATGPANSELVMNLDDQRVRLQNIHDQLQNALSALEI